MQKYTLVSVKGNKTLVCDLQHAIGVAIAMESELMPAWGVQIEDADGEIVADIQEGVNMTAVYAEDDWKTA
jgi:hypothetical protein